MPAFAGMTEVAYACRAAILVPNLLASSVSSASMQFSLEGRFTLLFVVLAIALLAVFTAVLVWLGSFWIAAGVALLVGAPLSMFAARLLTYPITRTVQA